MKTSAVRSISLLILGLCATVSPAPAQLVRSGSSLTVGGITPAVDAFRLDLGGVLNPNVVGSFGSGRREINWDGVPAAMSAPNNLNANFFNSNSPRGVVFATPGTGFQVSGATTDAGTGQPAAADFGNINPAYTSTFQPFSPQRLFTVLGSNIVDVSFFVPGTSTPALSKGFGSIFSDVDLANTTSLQFFDASNSSLGTFFAPSIEGNETFSFLGVSFASPLISRVQITNGNQSLSAATPTGDVVVMDDFIFAEPVAAVPETGDSLFLLALSLTGVLVAQRLISRRELIRAL